MGVALFEGTVVENIVLAEGEENHTVNCVHKDDQHHFSLTCRWVADALGRRRLLQTQLGLKREHEHHASAAWWRYTGRIDIEDMAAKTSRRWLNEYIEDRYFSTNHMMDKGYWVWFIPLGSGATSVGIVTDETIHPQNTYGTSYQKALEWLHAHEPVVQEFLKDKEPLDFLSFKNYSYASAQVFSHRRWSCVGEAGFFLDPLYSVGSDFIATTNTVTVEMIRRDRAGTLTEADVKTYNKLVIEIFIEICLGYYCNTYRCFGHAQIFTAKLAWDTAVHWAYVYQVYVQGFLHNPTPEVLALGERYRDLNYRVQKLFADWSDRATPRDIYVRGDMTRMRFLQPLHLKLAVRREPHQVLDVARKNLDHLEELAQILFWQAVEESYPENEMLKTRPWVRAWRMVLDPTKWDEEGIFETQIPPRPLDDMRDNFTGLFAPQNLRDRLVYNLPFNIMHWQKGYVHYHVVPVLHRRFIFRTPAMWVRNLFVADRQA